MYADWLQENGQSDQAEFIRAQIETTRLPPNHPNAKTLRARVVELAERYGETWGEGAGERQHVFVRGFVSAVQVEELGDYCLAVSERANRPAYPLVVDRHPIRVVYASHVYEQPGGPSATCPFFARLTGLGSNSRGWGGESVAHVLTNPHLAGLKMLDFCNGDYNGTEAARGIAAATHLTNLRVLDLTGNRIGDEGMEALAGAKHLSGLRALRLGTDMGDAHNGLTDDALAALARSRSFSSLTQLILSGNDFDSDGVKRLLKADWIGNLTELDLGLTWNEERVMAVARSRRLVNLRRLSVGRITENAARAFLRSKWFPNLTELHHYTGDENAPPSPELRTALTERFGPITGIDYFVPSPLCWEGKVAWRMQMLLFRPPATTEDCEAV
jgi:hypothetical protein